MWMWDLDHKEGWAPENQCFWTVVLENLESSSDSTEIKPVNPKENQPDYSLKVLILKLKLHYFGHLMWRTTSLEKTLVLGKIEGNRRRERQMRLLDGITDSVDMSLSKVQEIVKDIKAWCVAVHGVCKSKSQTRLRDWKVTTTNGIYLPFIIEEKTDKSLRTRVTIGGKESTLKNS